MKQGKEMSKVMGAAMAAARESNAAITQRAEQVTAPFWQSRVFERIGQLTVFLHFKTPKQRVSEQVEDQSYAATSSDCTE